MADDGNMTREPDLDDPGLAMAHRAIEAIRAEFAGDDQVPRFVVVVETPPEGEVLTTTFGARTNMASTADDAIDTHRLLTMAAAAVRSGLSPAQQRDARRLWDIMRAGFERRQ